MASLSHTHYLYEVGMLKVNYTKLQQPDLFLIWTPEFNGHVMAFANQGSVKWRYDLTSSAGGCNGNKCVRVYLTQNVLNFQYFVAEM